LDQFINFFIDTDSDQFINFFIDTDSDQQHTDGHALDSPDADLDPAK
jgi:hypothetical protein